MTGRSAVIARWRTEDGAQRAKVRGEDFRRPEEQLFGQLGMFEDGVA